MSKANRNRRVARRHRKHFVEIYSYYYRTHLDMYILQPDGTKKLLERQHYDKPPITVLDVHEWPWDANPVPTPPGTEVKTSGAIAFLGDGGLSLTGLTAFPPEGFADGPGMWNGISREGF